MKPSATLTATPMLNAQNGFQPTACRSRNRVVSPMLRKQKMNVQVRSDTSGASTLGRTLPLKSAALKLPVNAVISAEATRNPITNFGKRHQISRASGRLPPSPFSPTLATPVWEEGEGGSRPDAREIWWRFPKFVIGFLVASALMTAFTGSFSAADFSGRVRPNVLAPLVSLRTWTFIFCFLSIGLTTRFRDLHAVGWKPFI